MMRKRLRTVYATTALLAIASMIVPLMNFNANAQFRIDPDEPQAPMTQTEQTAEMEQALAQSPPQIPVVSGTDKEGGQHIVPLKSTYHTASQTLTPLEDFTLVEENIIPLNKGEDFMITLTPPPVPPGQIISVTATTMDGEESVDLERIGLENKWSLYNLPDGDEFIITIKTDLGIGTELVNEGLIVFGGAGGAGGSEESEYYGTTINKYTTNKQTIDNIILRITVQAPATAGKAPLIPNSTAAAAGAKPAPGTTPPGAAAKPGECPPPSKPVQSGNGGGVTCVAPANPDGTCPPPSTKQGDKCVQPPTPGGQPGGQPGQPDPSTISPNGKPFTPTDPINGVCVLPTTLQEGKCVLPLGSIVFPPNGPNGPLFVAPNGNIELRAPGKDPVVVCPAVILERDPPIILPCKVAILPNGDTVLSPPIPTSTCNCPVPAAVQKPTNDCDPGWQFKDGKCEKTEMPKTEEQKCKDKDSDDWYWDEDDDECKKKQKQSSGGGGGGNNNGNGNGNGNGETYKPDEGSKFEPGPPDEGPPAAVGQ